MTGGNDIAYDIELGLQRILHGSEPPSSYNAPMKPSAQTFDEQFLQMRERCLSLAADLDRVGRAPGGHPQVANDRRYRELMQAIALLSSDQPNRARRVLETFSDK